MQDWTRRARWGLAWAALAGLSLGGCETDGDAGTTGGGPGTGSLFDLTTGSTIEGPDAYLPEVMEFDLQSLEVNAPNGMRLMLNGVFTAKARFEVTADPFKTELTYGVSAADGTSCVLGNLEAAHLDVYYDEAERANAAVVVDDTPAPSLDPCQKGGTCATEGEECIGFYEAPPVSEEQAAAEEVPEPREVWQCMTAAYATKTVAERTTVRTLITPADLAGDPAQGTYEVQATTTVPAACKDLVGKGDLTLWAAFDLKGATAFAQRPAGATIEDAEGHTILSDDPSLHRLPAFDAPLSLSLDDGQELTLDFIALNAAGSVISYTDQVTDDPTVVLNAKIAVSGMEIEDEVAVGTSPLAFVGGIKPLTYLDGCADRPTGTESEDVEFILGEENDGSPIIDTVHSGLVGDAQAVVSREIDVLFTGTIRDRIFTGDWQCADSFEIGLCMSTLFPITQDSPDCRNVTVQIIREGYEGGSTTVPGASGGGSQPKNMQSCDETLLKSYQDWSRKKQEAEDLAQLHKYYVVDAYRYNEADAHYGPWTSHQHWKELYKNWTTRSQGWARLRTCYEKSIQNHPTSNSVDYSVQECKGEAQSIMPKSAYDYIREYYWNRVKDARKDPIKWGEDNFNGQCPGIVNGNICGVINNDPNRVGELKNKVLNLLNSNNANDSLARIMNPSDGHRCLGSLRALRRVNYTMNGYGKSIYDVVSDDGAFFTDYLTAKCAASHYEQERTKVWNQIQAKCAAPPTSSVDSTSGYSGSYRLVDKWVKTGGTGDQHAVELKFSAGLINDLRLRGKNSSWEQGDMKFTFGPEVRLWLDVNTGDWRTMFSLHDIYKWHMQAEFYATDGGKNAQATWIDAGQHVLLRDIYRIRFPMPNVPAVEWPEPPGFSKEKEKCQYLRPGASPVSLELCASMAAKAEIGISAKILANGVKGSDEGESDSAKATWPGVEGKVEPGAALVAGARVGVDFLAGSVGVKVEVDMVKIGYPLAIGTRWTMKPVGSKLDFKINPYISFSREVSSLSGSISAYLRMRFPAKEWAQKLYEWNGYKTTKELFGYQILEKGTKSL